MADASKIDLSDIPDAVLLPESVVRIHGLSDWLAISRLSAVQRLLLNAFNSLNVSRKEQLLHGLMPGTSVPASKIKPLYEEQMRDRT